jgi:flavin reductase (DIM6/NTAB) family NADH-FMN oxidoreductase RutF
MVAIGPRRDGTRKDTLRNILDTGEFTINLVSEPMLERMHRSSLALPPDVSEFDLVGLRPRKSLKVLAPGVEDSPVTFEMRLRQVMTVEGTSSTIVLGDVVLFQVREGLLKDGQALPEALQTVGRLGQDSYTVVERIIRLDPVR